MKDIKGVIKTIKTIRAMRRILLACIFILIVAFVAFHIFVNIKGKPLVAKKLSEAFNREVTISHLSISFPADIHIKNIQAKGLFRIPEVVAGGGLFDVFRKSFRLSLLKIVNPEVTLERNFVASGAEALTPGDINAQDTVNKQGEAKKKSVSTNVNPAALPQNRFLFPRLIIKRLIISDGTVNFTDNISVNQAITIKVEKINVKLENLDLSGSGNLITYFRCNGAVPWGEAKEAGKIEVDGWVNLFKKDIQASLKIQDIDGIYLYPYYAKWVDLGKARIEKAKLNFTSNIQGLNNDLTAACHLELTDIVRKPRSEDETKDKAEKIADAVLEIFKALNQGKIVLDFTVKTKMDYPQFGIGDVKSAVETKLTEATKNSGFQATDVLRVPGKVVEGGVKGVTDITKAFIDGGFAIGGELKKAFEGAFKKEPKETK